MNRPSKRSITPLELLSVDDQQAEALAWVFEHVDPEEICDDWKDFDSEEALHESGEETMYWITECKTMIYSSFNEEYDYEKAVQCLTTAMGYGMLYKPGMQGSETMLKRALEALQDLPPLTRQQQTKVLHQMCRFGFRILAAVFAMYCNAENISSRLCFTLAEELIEQQRWSEAIQMYALFHNRTKLEELKEILEEDAEADDCDPLYEFYRIELQRALDNC